MDNNEKRIIETIDKNRDKIISFAKSIKGEPGFAETDTASLTKTALASLGLTCKDSLALTGVKAVLNSSGPQIAILAELDGIYCPSHPLANSLNGISHACGHSAQLAAMYGAAIALCSEDIAQRLCGSVAFFAVPAEEFLGKKEREHAKNSGIKFMSGKSELIRQGEFDDIKLCLASHAHMVQSKADILCGLNATCGYIAKQVIFTGKAAHAAAAPWNGVNALSAATLAINAIGLAREQFCDEDCIRIHTNIIKGGNAVNVIPDEVILEAMVRGKTQDAINSAAHRFDEIMTHCALAFGAKANIINLQGYMPVPVTPAYKAQQLACDALAKLGLNAHNISNDIINYASTDLGDLSTIMPIIGFTHGGFSGALHSAEFTVTNEEIMYIAPAKMLALTAYHLLQNNAELCQDAINSYGKTYTQNQYIEAVEAMLNG